MFPQIILQALFGNPIYPNVSGKQVSQKKKLILQVPVRCFYNYTKVWHAISLYGNHHEQPKSSTETSNAKAAQAF